MYLLPPSPETVQESAARRSWMSASTSCGL